MNPYEYKSVTQLAVGLGAAFTVVALTIAGGVSALPNGFTLYSLFPYLLLLSAPTLARTHGRSLCTLIVVMLIIGSAAIMYVGALTTFRVAEGWLFLLIPIYQLMAAALLLFVLLLCHRAPGAERPKQQ